MKKLILLSTIFVCVIINAQEIDKSKLIVKYKILTVRDTLRNNVVPDDLNLLIGSSYSLYYSTKWEALEEKYKGYTLDTNPLNVLVLNSGSRNIILNKYNTGELQVLEPIKRDNYTYNEPNNLMDWKIESKNKTILGYNCQKAVVKYGGRSWTAWFTTDIPLSEGPWIFKGLPGLILEVEDSQSYFKFNALALEKKIMPIIFSDKSFTKTTKQNVKKILKMYYIDMVRQNTNLENNYPDLIQKYGSEINERRLSGLAQNPIEREQKTKKTSEKK